MEVLISFIYLSVVLAHVSKKSCKLRWKIFNSNLEMEGPSNSGMLGISFAHFGNWFPVLFCQSDFMPIKIGCIFMQFNLPLKNYSFPVYRFRS